MLQRRWSLKWNLQNGEKFIPDTLEVNVGALNYIRHSADKQFLERFLPFCAFYGLFEQIVKVKLKFAGILLLMELVFWVAKGVTQFVCPLYVSLRCLQVIEQLTQRASDVLQKSFVIWLLVSLVSFWLIGTTTTTTIHLLLLTLFAIMFVDEFSEVADRVERLDQTV